MSYPEHDDQYEDHQITAVSQNADGSGHITYNGDSCVWIPKSTVHIEVGNSVRLYGRGGLGSTVRGIFIEGTKLYYRTEAEDKEQSEIDAYGKDCIDWLKRWDAGQLVWSISMGGFGPGYEQALQIACTEILRIMIKKNFDHATWKLEEKWKSDRKTIEAEADIKLDKLGLSGAQFGAALQLATKLYMHGPREIMKMDAVKDRHIQIGKHFPTL